jgi:hypothetical protein
MDMKRSMLRESGIRMKTLAVICMLAAAAQAQDRHDWQSIGQLRSGDPIRLSLKTGPVDGPFQSWTPQDVTAGTMTARKDDVLKIERFGAGHRAKHAAIGAAIGFGAGFGVGAGVSGCGGGQLGPCISRGAGGALGGGVGAILGAAIGALLPGHRRELIYSSQ